MSMDRSSMTLPQISPRFGAQASLGAWSSFHYTPGLSTETHRKKNDSYSCIGSFENLSYQSGGGNVIIPDCRVKWQSNSKLGSLENIEYTPRSGNVQIQSEKLKWVGKAKVGSLDNVGHKPFKRKFKVSNFKKDWNAQVGSKVRSLSHQEYKPKKGNVQILSETLKWNTQSKISKIWKKKKKPYLSNYESGSDYEDGFEDKSLDSFGAEGTCLNTLKTY